MSSSTITPKPTLPRTQSSPVTQHPVAQHPVDAPATSSPQRKAGTSRATPLPTAGAPAAQQAIVCPVLGALVAEGKVPMASDGTVKLDDLNHALAQVGLSKPYQAVIHPTGWGANSLGDLASNLKGDQFNVLELRSGNIKHPGDSAILTNGAFDEAKFEALVSHAKNGVMTEASFGEAIAANVRRDSHDSLTQSVDAHTRGKTFSEVEFGALLGAFGTKDASGKLGISVNDLRNLYQHQTLPPGRSGAGTVTNAAAITASLELKADAALAGHALDSFMTATGLANRGAKLAEGRSIDAPVASQAAVSAGKAANCPHMNGGLKVPSGAATLNAHTPAK